MSNHSTIYRHTFYMSRGIHTRQCYCTHLFLLLSVVVVTLPFLSHK